MVIGHRSPLRLALPLTALASLLLAGCAPAASSGPSPSPSIEPQSAPSQSAPSAAAPTPTPTPTPSEVELPADALLHVTATATASTGAILFLDIVVLKSRIWSDPVALPRANATAKRCGGGEIDLPTIKSGKWMFAEADYTATLADGSAAWPSGLPMLLGPYGNNAESRTASGDVYQKEYTQGGAGDYEPMCAQRAFLKGPGTGAIFLGAPGPAALKKWASEVYGFDFSLPTKKADPAKVTISDCVGTITALGHSLGAPNAAWVTTTSPTECLVGDPQKQNDPHT